MNPTSHHKHARNEPTESRDPKAPERTGVAASSRCWLLALLLLLAPCHAFAQADVQALQRQLDAHMDRAADQNLSPGARAQACEEALTIRQRLLERFPRHPDAPIWRVDQAVDLLAKLGKHALDTTALFGLLSPEEHARVSSLAERALILARHEPRADDRARRGLARARAACILSAVAREPGPRESLAREALAAASPAGLESDVNRLRAACESWALHALGQYESARVAAAAALEEPQPRDILQLELSLARARARAALGDAPAALARLEPLLAEPPVASSDSYTFDVFLLADAWGLIAATRPDTRPRAFDIYLDLFGDPRADFFTNDRPDILYTRLGRLARALPDIPRPPRVQLAIALAQSYDGDPAALPALDRLARESSDQTIASEAAWHGAILRLRSDDAATKLEALDALVGLARASPESPLANDALEQALTWGRALSQGPDAPPGAAALYDEALGLVTQRDVPSRDAWLYERARRLAEQDNADSLLAALDTLEAIAADSDAGDAGATLYASIGSSIAQLAWSSLRALRANGRDQALKEVVRDEFLPLFRRLAGFCAARGLDEQATRFRADLAEAMVEVDEPGASVIATDVLERSVPVPGGEARMRLVRGRALLLADDPAPAFAELRKVTELVPRPPTSEDLLRANPDDEPSLARAHDTFWHAWTLILETLAEQNADGSRTGAISARVAWLRQIDPGLGGAPWRARIEQAPGSGQ